MTSDWDWDWDWDWDSYSYSCTKSKMSLSSTVIIVSTKPIVCSLKLVGFAHSTSFTRGSTTIIISEIEVWWEETPDNYYVHQIKHGVIYLALSAQLTNLIEH